MVDRTQAPAFSVNHDFELVPCEEQVAGNSRFFFIANKQQPVLKIEFVFQSGKWQEHVPGLANATSGLLLKGTQSKTSLQIAAAFDQLGSQVEIQTGNDFTSVALYCLSKHAIDSIKLLQEVFTSAAFPEHEIEHYKQVQLQNLQINNEKTSYVATKLFREKLFGVGHPYGWDVSTESIRSLSRPHLADVFKKYYCAPSIFVAGDLNPDIRNFLLNELHFNPQTPFNRAVGINQPENKSWSVDKEGSTQSSVRLGTKTINRTNSDFYKLVLVNHILGGYFGSRLMKNIREEKGLTYGIYSSISPLVHDSFFVIGADVNKENRSLIFDEIRNEMKALATLPISGSELSVAKNHFIGSLQADMTSIFAHAEKHKNIILHKLPKDYYSKLIAAVAGMNEDDIQTTSEKYLSYDRMIEVAVG